jgi:hypothetical protein
MTGVAHLVMMTAMVADAKEEAPHHRSPTSAYQVCLVSSDVYEHTDISLGPDGHLQHTRLLRTSLLIPMNPKRMTQKLGLSLFLNLPHGSLRVIWVTFSKKNLAKEPSWIRELLRTDCLDAPRGKPMLYVTVVFTFNFHLSLVLAMSNFVPSTWWKKLLLSKEPLLWDFLSWYNLLNQNEISFTQEMGQ